jgi:hypothetical protein
MALKARSPLARRTPQIVQVEDMTGGVDLRRSPTLLQPKRARSLLNWSLEEPGALVVRPGYQQASSVTWFAGRGQGGERVYLANAVFTLLAGAGAVYKPNDAFTQGTTAVYSTISPTNQVFFPYDRDLVAVMDGANRPRFSTNGDTWNLMGTDAPSSAAVLSTVSTGGLSSGEYAVAYAYKHRGTAHESNTSTESTITLTASSGAVHATASPSTDPKVDAYVWYARHKLPDGESVLRKFSSGGASTVTINSSAWTANDEAPTNHHVPQVVSFGAIWKSRWWAKDAVIGNRLRFTELFLPQAWPSLYFIDIPFEKGDEITAIQPLGDTLLVHGQSGIYLVIGQTSLDFEVRPSQGAEGGAYGPRAVAKVEQTAVHASADGVNSFDGVNDRNLEHDISPAWTDLNANTGSTSLAQIASVHDVQRHEFRLSVPRVYPTGVRGEWILNFDRTRENDGVPAWTTTNRDIAFYMHWNGNEPTAGNRGRIFTMPSTSGVVFEENVGATANSSNMTAEYEGPALALGLHRARLLDLHVEYEPNAGALTAETVVDGVSQGGLSLPIGSGLAQYDTSTYDLVTYDGVGRRKAYTLLPLGADGRTVTLKATYVGQARFRQFTYAYTVLPESQPRKVSE